MPNVQGIKSKTPGGAGEPSVPEGQYDIFNRLFGSKQEGGGYVADPLIAETMANREVLPAPISYSQPVVSPAIQRRVDLFSASNPADALRNPPAGPPMARDNGQAIARNTPGATGGGGQRPIWWNQLGEAAVPLAQQSLPIIQKVGSKLPQGGSNGQ